MEPQKNDWSYAIMIVGMMLGIFTGVALVLILSSIMGKLWGSITAVIILLAGSYLLYKTVIE